MQNAISLGTALLCAFVSTSFGAIASFQGLGILPGSSNSYAQDVSPDGSVVVGWGESVLDDDDCMAFLWTRDSGIVGIGGSLNTRAWGVSAHGAVVVGDIDGGGVEAFRWTESTGLIRFDTLHDGSVNSKVANGISADGQVIVGTAIVFSVPSHSEAFRWTQSAGVMTLGSLVSDALGNSHASGVSGDGSVVVGSSEPASDFSSTHWEAFRWTQCDGMVGLGDLSGDGFFSAATGVSSDGLVVVGNSESASGREAFRWAHDTGMVGLGDLPGGSFFSYAHDVSGDGSVVVGESRAALGSEAFIWDGTNGMRNLGDVLVSDYGLDLTSWILLSARGISDDGLTIVGEGVNPAGYEESWIATIPEPATVLLLGLGAVMLRRKRVSVLIAANV